MNTYIYGKLQEIFALARAAELRFDTELNEFTCDNTVKCKDALRELLSKLAVDDDDDAKQTTYMYEEKMKICVPGCLCFNIIYTLGRFDEASVPKFDLSICECYILINDDTKDVYIYTSDLA